MQEQFSTAKNAKEAKNLGMNFLWDKKKNLLYKVCFLTYTPSLVCRLHGAVERAQGSENEKTGVWILTAILIRWPHFSAPQSRRLEY